MAFGNALYRFLIFAVIFLIVVFVSLVHSSRTRLQIEVAEHHTASKATQDLESYQLVKSLGKGASAIVVVEDSEREVPTGPDPLHHNSKPARP